MGRRSVLAAGLAAVGVAAAGADGGKPGGDRHFDVLFVGAHPDDEHVNLATFGQWRERFGWTAAVVTVTRGEGGGNAAGPEEGAALGRIREVEERAATRVAGVRKVFYLDKPDFWYTLSAPLTARAWNARDTLERLVRLVRATTPDTVVVMDPRPFNQHGGHQLSARLGIEAFALAAAPDAFPEQRLRPWRARRLLAQNYGFAALLGPAAARSPRTDPHTGLPVLGVWSGTPSRHGVSWAQLARDAARKYRTQGFAALPERVPTDPGLLGSDWFTILADDGRLLRAPVRPQSNLKPLYAEFRRWTDRVGLPWLANDAQPDYPPPPTTVVPAVLTAPVVNGVEGDGEYPGPELPLTWWQGTAAPGFAAHAKVCRHDTDLYVLVRVRDERRGAALARDDVKRHWRTDAVEIALDPSGRSDDTSTTFKLGIVPFTASAGGPMAERDADARQGPAAVTAAGVAVAAVVTEPYQGYTAEARIPLNQLPAAVNPAEFAMNILVYDSNTQDKTGQARYAWSPFGSAQADPYVWGRATLADY
ncbi:MAG: hypothetical protein HOQ24_09155 [Mycobacteriaceae bacterium]|nr:hypothetical protein [Mycobacteriaceae bacterium]